MRINHSKELKEAIVKLKVIEAAQKEAMLEQFDVTLETLHPSNILKNSLAEQAAESSSTVLDNLMGLGAGFLVRKIVLGKSPSAFRKIIANTLSSIVTRITITRADYVKAVLARLIKKYAPRAEREA